MERFSLTVTTLLFVCILFLTYVCEGSSGVTSSFIRSEWPAVDIPLDNKAFVVPDGHNAPQQVHITQGDYDGKAVIISWVTPDEPGSSTVHYGTSEDNYEFVRHYLTFSPTCMRSYKDYFSNTSSISHHKANLRVFHGGDFVTKERKTEYVCFSERGAMYTKMDMEEICYFNLADLVKKELGYEEVGELWYRRKGLSLFNGRKRYVTDADLEPFLATKDSNGFVTLYVVHRNALRVGEGILNSQPSQQSNNKSGPTKDASKSGQNTDFNTNTSSSLPTQPQNFNIPKVRSKLPLRNPLKPTKTTEKRVVGARVPQKRIFRSESAGAAKKRAGSGGTSAGVAKKRASRGGSSAGAAQKRAGRGGSSATAGSGGSSGPSGSGGSSARAEEISHLNVDDSPGERVEQEKGSSESESDGGGSDLSLSDSDFEEDDDLFVENVDDDVLDSVQTLLAPLQNPEVEAQVEAEDGHDNVSLSDDEDLDSDEDELGSEIGSDDDDVSYPIFNPQTDFKRSVELSLGQKFPNNKVFRKALRFHAIQEGYDYYLLHNGKLRVTAYCRKRCDCPWVKKRAKLGACGCETSGKCKYKVHAKKVSGENTFQIRGLRLKHSCGWSDYNSKVTSEYLAERFVDCFREDPNWKLETFQGRVLKEVGVEVGYYKVYYARKLALKMIFGEAAEQYKRVWDYAETLKKYNPESSVFVKLTNIESGSPLFQRMYVCLSACREGFVNGCRPVIGVDGCHLKGAYPGQLLTAVAKDGNGNIFPVAWAIVEVENSETWSWFLELLVKDVAEVLDNLTFMSDRQKGLLDAFSKVVPNVDIRFCCRHIWSNFKQSFPGVEFKQCFWQAARAYTKADFDKRMELIKSMSQQAYAYLMAIPLKSWARHAFTTKSSSSMLVNNCCESFNNVLRKCRDQPVLTLMEWIRRYTMKRMFNKKEGACKFEGPIMRGVMNKLSKTGIQSRQQCRELQCELNLFEVEHKEDRFVVDLEKWSCDCFKWNLTGVPCVHAYKCIIKKRLNPQSFVHQAYSLDTYKKAYAKSIKPLPGPKQWERTQHPEPSPPPYKKQPGRPSLKKRKKEAGENQERRLVKKKKIQKKCGNCGNLGHNKKGCKNSGVAQAPRQGRQQIVESNVQDEFHLTQGHPQPSQSVVSPTPTGASATTTRTVEDTGASSMGSVAGSVAASVAGEVAMQVAQQVAQQMAEAP